ncbi:hypothetical protein Emag_001740 [Eimeria magna]
MRGPKTRCCSDSCGFRAADPFVDAVVAGAAVVALMSAVIVAAADSGAAAVTLAAIVAAAKAVTCAAAGAATATANISSSSGRSPGSYRDEKVVASGRAVGEEETPVLIVFASLGLCCPAAAASAAAGRWCGSWGTLSVLLQLLLFFQKETQQQQQGSGSNSSINCSSGNHSSSSSSIVTMSVRLARSVLLSRRQGRFPDQRGLLLLPCSGSVAAAAAACCSRGILSPHREPHREVVLPHVLSCRLLSSSSSSSGPASAVSDAAVDGFLSGTAASYAEQMFVAWRRDPTSVHASWAAYFTNIENGLSPALAFSPPPLLYSSPGAHQPAAAPASVAAPAAAAAAAAAGGAAAGGQSQQSALPIAPEAAGSLPFSALPHQSVHDTSRLIQMIRGYQTRGHELANINPLSLPRKPPYCTSRAAQRPLLLSPEQYGFTAADLDRVFDTRVPGMQGFLAPDSPPRPLRELVKRLKETYCGSMGVEYMHIADTNVCNFIRQKLETERQYLYSRDSRKKILTRMARAQLFENFCASKFATTRRFGLDGCETLIVGMKAITKRAAVEGVESVVIGMAHRGRLNVLVNVMHKPMQQLLSEFQGVSGFGSSEWGNTGDVKYHLGVEFDLFDRDSQRNVHMCILPNPSHLEAVDPLVLGLARAQQYFRKDADRSLVLPILVHGDASLAGQGVVYETLQMCALPNYTVGGAIHLVVNNQIGFTTNPVDSGSGKYCTDIAKAVEAPIIHVNAEDPEAVTFACELALEYRQKFKHDVFVDIVGYRRFGHNELDMPKFTQPLTYTLIARKKPALELYADKLIHEVNLRTLHAANN